MSRAAILAVSLLICGTETARSAEIDPIEDYVLASDRMAALARLIPGSEDYYYYHCLHYQATEQFDKSAELLSAWIKRYKYTPRVYEIQNRQALLTYELTPQQTLDLLEQRLKLRFDHQRDRLGETPNLPTELDPQLISRQRLRALALRQYKNLDGFEDAALDWLVAADLDPDRRRNLLERLERPDHESLAELVVADLNHRYSKPFGSLAIQRDLLRAQLDEVVRLKPDLLSQTEYVQIYISKLRANDDADWRHDTAEYEAYLTRLWDFVSQLAPAHNSLKAHVLYHRLAFDRRQGQYSRAHFMTYLGLPRQVHYIKPAYLALPRNRQNTVNLNEDYSRVTGLPPVGNDEPIVRSYLQHFFLTETTTQPYEPFIEDSYLRQQFAEAKIVNGLGEEERWYSMLPPEKYQALKERIDLEFAATNKQQFDPADPVALDLFVKNVETLIVKVYEVNTANFYRRFEKQVNTDVNLDGLVANQERTFQYSDPPLRRIKRRFEFPELSKRGVYVVDFIGNGLSSRAVIRKGQWRHLMRHTHAGHLFTVLDERNQQLQDASLWLGGRSYTADENGQILVPYSTEPSRQAIILSSQGFSTLAHLQHEAESYSLSAGFYVDRETLLSRRSAELLVRPGLTVNGTRVPLALLDDITLLISSTDHRGVVSTHQVEDFELSDDRESTHLLQVPADLSRLKFELRATLPRLTGQGKIEVSADDEIQLNQIATTEHVDDFHLSRTEGGYYLELLGRTGEQKIDRSARVSLKHRDFRNPVQVVLQTDHRSRINLGRLAGIESLSVTSATGTTRSWKLAAHDQHWYHRTISGVAGQPVEIPYMGSGDQLSRADISLLERRGPTYFADRFEAAQLRGGMLVIAGLDAGDYDLLLKPSGESIRLRIVAGTARHSYAAGQNRLLEMRGQRPLQIVSLSKTDDSLRIETRNAGRTARLHIFATRYEPAFSAFSRLATVSDSEPAGKRIPRTLSLYAAGRSIGDEYQYIIDRRYAHKYPGLMLDRPSLLLNPWSLRGTETDKQAPSEGTEFGAEPEAAAAEQMRREAAQTAAKAAGDFANLDFLRDASLVVANLTPDEQGVVEFPAEELGAYQQVHVVAVDAWTTASRSLALPERRPDFVDLRLAAGLDPERHFTQQKQISIIQSGDTFRLADITSSRFEVYDSLARVHALYATLNSDPQWAEFQFVLRWPRLSSDEKRDLYSKYACHELNFFLARKDPEFFAAVVQPFLDYKMDKTFLDHWLLGDQLGEFTGPWRYERLNCAERILLSQRIARDREHTQRDILDRYALIPIDLDRFNYLFRTAIATTALNADDTFGFEDGLAGARNYPRSEGSLGQLSGGGGANFFSGRGVAPNAPGFRASGVKKSKQLWNKLSRSRLAMDRMDFDAGAGEIVREIERLSLAAQPLYQTLDTTKEWAENNYYKLPIEQQNADLITVNRFWRDYADHDPEQPFLSSGLAEATGNFAEMMLALALLDLPFESPQHETDYEGRELTLTANGPLIVFHEEIRPAQPAGDETPILVSQNFFQRDDRYRHVGSERRDKFVTEEFLVHTVYGCQVVVTNPTSSPQKLDLLLQVPVGAIPVLSGQQTSSEHIQLEPYNTKTIEYFFYFPAAGRYPHYPVHVAKNEQFIAAEEAVTLAAVEKLSRVDRESWEYISQNGSSQDVLTFLGEKNLHRVELSRIAFRMKDRPFFLKVVEVLERRHHYDHTLFSYAVKHNHVLGMREYLQHADEFVQQCGLIIDSALLTIDPVARRSYQHTDFRPLVNARAHQLGRRRQILNDRLFAQYHQLLKLLSYGRELNSDERLAMTYYMLLQDRIEEAFELFAGVDRNQLATTMQYDYFDAYLAMYGQEVGRARSIVAGYTDHKVDRWRNTFASLDQQLDEIAGSSVEIVDDEDRNQSQTQLADSDASLDFTVEAKQVTVRYQNVGSVDVNYYLMDIELLYSRNPFVQQYSEQFSHIRPNRTERLTLPADQSSYLFPLPDDLQNRNVLIELRSGGEARTQVYYSNAISVQLVENYGQLRVTHGESGRPLPTVYAKVYARMKDGSLRFYKDGYTDLRGRFDYSSLSTNDLDHVDRFAVLVLSDEHGAVVREAAPPIR